MPSYKFITELTSIHHVGTTKGELLHIIIFSVILSYLQYNLNIKIIDLAYCINHKLRHQLLRNKERNI